MSTRMVLCSRCCRINRQNNFLAEIRGFRNQPALATRSPRLTSLSRAAGLCRASFGNPPKRSLPWRASPRNFPTTSPQTRPRRWWRLDRATLSGWSCASCSGPDSGCPSACPSGPRNLRLTQDPPILSLRPDVPGNKARQSREAPVSAGLVESLADLKSFHRRERNRPCFDMSRQWVSKSMEEEAVVAGIDPARD